MSTLIIGGTGKSLTPLCRRLQRANSPFLVTSRRGQAGAPAGMRAVRFDWNDRSSWEEVFSAETIRAVVMTAPLSNEPADVMNPFIDFAKAKDASRFVLIAGLSVKKGGPWLGQVYQHLDDIKVEYCVVKPLWFMENLLDPPHLETIKNEGKFYSACGDGLCPRIASEDIGEVAFHAATDAQAPDHEYCICGPKSISMAQIAATLSKALGRQIEHVQISDEENAKHLEKAGMPDMNVKLYSRLEMMTRNGDFDFKGPNDVERVTGRSPMHFEDWVEAHKAEFA